MVAMCRWPQQNGPCTPRGPWHVWHSTRGADATLPLALRPLADATNSGQSAKRRKAGETPTKAKAKLTTRGVRTRTAVAGAAAMATALPAMLLAATLSAGSPPTYTQMATPDHGSAARLSPKAPPRKRKP